MSTNARRALRSDADAETTAVLREDPAFSEPKTHNALIGDVAALEEAWERDGYWLFRDVLHKPAVARARRIYLEELARLGVIAADGSSDWDEAIYNGGSLEGFPRHMEPLAARKTWQGFFAEPQIHAFFVRLFRDEPFWVPYTEYRAVPPAFERDAPRLVGIHQDGPHTPGIDFRTVWVPIAEIDDDAGGVAFTEGLAQRVNRHVIDAEGGNQLIRPDDLPAGCWRRTRFSPGDVLFIHPWSPHSGLTNVSTRFRLSLDHRVMKRSDRYPLVGVVVDIADDHVAVRDETGITTVRIDGGTYVRDVHAQRLKGAAITREFVPGTPVIVGYDDGVATVVRPQHSA